MKTARTTSNCRLPCPSQTGFTLIELMVVIGIIGVLATMAFSFMQSSRKTAFDISAKHDLKEFITAQESYFNENQKFNGNPGQSIRNDGVASDFALPALSITAGVVITVVAGDPDDPYNSALPYTVQARHKDSAKVYSFDFTANLITEN